MFTAFTGMAHIAITYIVNGNTGMSYSVVAHTVMAYVALASVAMAYAVMACVSGNATGLGGGGAVVVFLCFGFFTVFNAVSMGDTINTVWMP